MHLTADNEAPWAMQIVVQAEKQNPPSHIDALEATAKAVVTVLHRASADPESAESARVQRWLEGRIRKITRRARGSLWERALSETGDMFALVEHGGARVAAFVPRAMDDVPAALSKLQVTGLNFPDSAPVGQLMPAQEVRILLNPDVQLSTGKACAQVGHAAQLAQMKMSASQRSAWADAGFPLTVVPADPRAWGEVAPAAPVRVQDAGFTEIEPGTLTCVALLSI